MRAYIKLYLNNKTAKGYPVTFFYVDKKVRKKISLGWYFKKNEWNFSNETPLPLAENYDFVYPKLLNLRLQINKLYFEGETDFLKYEALFKQSDTHTSSFYDFADYLVIKLQKLGKNSNAKVYDTAVKQLKKIYPQLEFKNLNYAVLKKFKDTLVLKNLKNSTIHNYLRTLRAIYNEAVLQGLVKQTDLFSFIFKDIKVRKFRTKNKYLKIKSIKKLERAKLIGFKAKVRDIFLLQFYFGGQDLIDIYYLKQEQFKNNRVYFTRKKMGDAGYEFDLPIIKKVEKIIANFTPENEYLIPGRKDFDGYNTFRRRYQKYLKQLQTDLNLQVLPKNENLGIKVARYTFANNAKLLGIDSDLLRELMGHERQEIDTIYKDCYPEKIRDKAYLKIIKT